jgi:DUF2934 family protein
MRSSNPTQLKQPDLHEAITRRAREIYEDSGRIPGRDLQNWSQAEAEVMSELANRSPRRAAIMIKINGVEYIGEYSLAQAGGYTPGEFSPADQVSVRFEGEKMFVKRPNGQELETRIVKRVG